MSDNVRDLPRCQGFKGDGTPCERIVGVSQKYCYSHDESRAAERKANASKAAKAKISELTEVKQRLRELADSVLSGEVDRANGSVASQILATWLKAVAIELKVTEQRELTERLEALEELQQRAAYR